MSITKDRRRYFCLGHANPGITACFYARSRDEALAAAAGLGTVVASSRHRNPAQERAAATKPMKLDAAQQKRLLRLYQHGEPVSQLTAMFGISRSTLFRTLKVLKQREPISA
jgi:transcriptional regulator of acetoin/glycerol metabolism